jgi:hypothetical protein
VAARLLLIGSSEETAMLDVLYIGLIVGFLALSWGLVELCDRL